MLHDFDGIAEISKVGENVRMKSFEFLQIFARKKYVSDVTVVLSSSTLEDCALQ